MWWDSCHPVGKQSCLGSCLSCSSCCWLVELCNYINLIGGVWSLLLFHYQCKFNMLSSLFSVWEEAGRLALFFRWLVWPIKSASAALVICRVSNKIFSNGADTCKINWFLLQSDFGICKKRMMILILACNMCHVACISAHILLQHIL